MDDQKQKKFRLNPGTLLVVLFLFVLASSCLGGFLSIVASLYATPSLVDMLTIFVAGGMFALFTAAIYGVFIKIMNKKTMSRKGFLISMVALSWGMFSATMQIYPWNCLVALVFLGVGIAGYYKHQWKFVDGKWIG